jgi:trk system potassium uptake protein TrkH
VKTRGVRRLATLWRNLSAPQLFVLSFLLLIGLGTVGFEMLPGLYIGPGLSWIDALFTSTSAVCVTGLIVVDTATYFTPAGQAYVLLLIQLGGLGIITFTSILVTLMGIRLSLRQERLSAEAAAPVPRIDHRRLARHVILFTLAIELAGAALLFLGWRERLDGALWHAVFHAVSAFCNAGFSTFSDSLVRFADEPLPLVIVMVLIVSGGIGFLTFEEMHLARLSRLEGRRFRLSVHSRLVLLTGATLLGGGWLMFVLFEWSTALGPMSIADKLVNALFMSVTARTAGFNTIDYAQATTSTNFLTILLMMVGGSPGSMAGGMKTTTLALIGLIAWNRLRGRTVVSAWGRSLPAETLQRAVTLFVVMVSVAVAGTFAFTMTDAASVPASSDTKFLTLAFEAVSALNTVGLSMGATPELSPMGRLMTVVLMYLGRVGPLTFALALARRKVEQGYRYAYEDVAIG